MIGMPLFEHRPDMTCTKQSITELQDGSVDVIYRSCTRRMGRIFQSKHRQLWEGRGHFLAVVSAISLAAAGAHKEILSAAHLAHHVQQAAAYH